MNNLMTNEPGYNVYLLYQKEVYNCDHSFLQSMMDWLYSSIDSPYKFRFRNKAFININHFGILIQKDNLLSNQNTNNLTNESVEQKTHSQTESFNWTSINFNLKHLKEIYVDKRHKDTCVLVSKVASNSNTTSTTPTNNYVWKSANPSNYQSFRSPYSLNNAYKKSYLLTIVKFKDGPGRLLQSIQLLDSILADYNKTPKNQSQNNEKNASNQKTRPNIQQYFNDYFSKQNQNNMQHGQQASHHHYNHMSNGSSASISASLMYGQNSMLGHNSLKAKQYLINNNTHLNSNTQFQKNQRRLSVDSNKQNSNNSLHLPYNNSNVSLENYARNSITPTNGATMMRSGTISRQSSSNEIRPTLPHMNNLGAHRLTNYFPNNSTYLNLNNASLNHFYPEHNYAAKINTGSVPASPAPSHHQKYSRIPMQQYQTNSRSSSKSSQINNVSSNKNDVNTSNENLSEIGYQQYKKKLTARAQRNNVPIVTSTSSLKNAEMFYPYSNIKNTKNSNFNGSYQQHQGPFIQNPFLNQLIPNQVLRHVTANKNSPYTQHDSSSSSLSVAQKSNNDIMNNQNFIPIRNQRINHILHPFYQNRIDNEQNFIKKYQENLANASRMHQKKNIIKNQRYGNIESDYEDDESDDDDDEKKTEDDTETSSSSESDYSRKKKSNSPTNSSNSGNNNGGGSVEAEKTTNKKKVTSPNLTNKHVYKIRSKYENNKNTGDIDKININYGNKKEIADEEEDDDEKTETVEKKVDVAKKLDKNQINFSNSLKYKENKYLNSTIKKSFSSVNSNSKNKLENQKSNSSSSMSSSSSPSSSSSSISSSKSSILESTAIKKISSLEQKKDASSIIMLPNSESLKLKNESPSESNNKLNKKILLDFLKGDFSSSNEKNNQQQQAESISNKIVIDRIKKFTPSPPLPTNISTSKISQSNETPIMQRKLNQSNSKQEIINTIEKMAQTSLKSNNKFVESPSSSPETKENTNQIATTALAPKSLEEVKIESNKVKDIIKSFNNIERRILTNGNSMINTTNDLNKLNTSIASSITSNSSNNYEKYFNQQLQAHQNQEQSQLNSSNDFTNKEKNDFNFLTQPDKSKPSDTAQNLNNKAKILANNITKMKMSSSCIQNGKETIFNNGTNSGDSQKGSNKMLQILKRNFDLSAPLPKTYFNNLKNSKSQNEKSMDSSLCEYSTLKSLKLQLNASYSNSTINFSTIDRKSSQSQSDSRQKDSKPLAVISPLSTSSESSFNETSPKPSSKHLITPLAKTLNQISDSNNNKSVLYSPHLRNKLHPNIQITKNDPAKNGSSLKANIFLNANSLKNSVKNGNLVQDENISKNGSNNETDITTPKLENKVTNGSHLNFDDKSPLDIVVKNLADKLNADRAAQAERAAQLQNQQLPSLPPQQRKRTFANMVWPMDPEEERILRSSSPYVVPEIIVQRNEGVKSILKKTSSSRSSSVNNNTITENSTNSSPTNNMSNNNNNNNNTLNSMNTSNNTTSPFAKKRVDFGENFLFFNFFDTYTEEKKPEKILTTSSSNVSNVSNNIITASAILNAATVN